MTINCIWEHNGKDMELDAWEFKEAQSNFMSRSDFKPITGIRNPKLNRSSKK